MLQQQTHEGPGATFLYEHVYTQEHVVDHLGLLWLNVSLGGHDILFPIVNVGDREKPVGIAFYDPSQERNPLLARVSVLEMGAHFTAFNAGLVIKTDSTKSGWFIEQAAGEVGAEIVTLPSGLDKAYVVAHSELGSIRPYVPVTLLGQNKEKYMGRPIGLKETIRRIIATGKKVVLADDVATLYATLDAMDSCVMESFPHGLERYFALIAREGELGANYPPPLRLNMRATIALPEIKGLDASKMTHISERSLIPRAIFL